MINEDEPLIEDQAQRPRLSSNSFQSAQSFGPEMNFGDMRRNISRQEIKKVWCDFIIDATFLTMILLSLKESEIYDKQMKKKTSCGIPVMYWLEMFFIIFGLRSLSQLARIYVIQNFYRFRQRYELSRLVLIDGAIIAWLVYGNTLFYSKKNDCEKYEATEGLNDLMQVILILGYLMMAMYLIILCSIPFLYYYIQSINEQRRIISGQINQDQVPSVLESLSRVAYNPNEFTHENQCSICLTDYAEMDIVTQLLCDKRHYFHTKCLEQWIQNGQNQCPLCRKPIQCADEAFVENDDRFSDADINIDG